MKPEWIGKKGNSLSERLEGLSIPEPNSGCWIWLGNIYSERKPYGRIDVGGRTQQAHRVSYETYMGRIPKGLQIRHNCDNPSCINPDHMTVGTSQQNVEDRDLRGRTRQGVKHANSKFSESDIREIRASSENNYALGRRYGVAESTIRHIKSRFSYRSVPEVTE